jgi:hypothetical protein
MDGENDALSGTDATQCTGFRPAVGSVTADVNYENTKRIGDEAVLAPRTEGFLPTRMRRTPRRRTYHHPPLTMCTQCQSEDLRPEPRRSHPI